MTWEQQETGSKQAGRISQVSLEICERRLFDVLIFNLTSVLTSLMLRIIFHSTKEWNGTMPHFAI